MIEGNPALNLDSSTAVIVCSNLLAIRNALIDNQCTSMIGEEVGKKFLCEMLGAIVTTEGVVRIPPFDKIPREATTANSRNHVLMVREIVTAIRIRVEDFSKLHKNTEHDKIQRTFKCGHLRDMSIGAEVTSWVKPACDKSVVDVGDDPAQKESRCLVVMGVRDKTTSAETMIEPKDC